jgi:hypothetical protein
MASLGGGRGGPRQSGEPVSGGAGQAVGSRTDARQGASATAGGGQGFQLPEVTDKECSAVTAALAKRPRDQATLDALRQQMMSGAIDRDAMRTETQKIYAAAGVDARVAAACRRRAVMGGGGAGGGGAFAGANGGGGAQGAGGARRRTGLVFVKTGTTYEPRLVMLGESNFDYTEVLSGVKEGEQVALLAAAALQAQRQQNNERFRQVTGVPGMNQQSGGAGGRGGAGGGGGARQGGGR